MGGITLALAVFAMAVMVLPDEEREKLRRIDAVLKAEGFERTSTRVESLFVVGYDHRVAAPYTGGQMTQRQGDEIMRHLIARLDSGGFLPEDRVEAGIYSSSTTHGPVGEPSWNSETVYLIGDETTVFAINGSSGETVVEVAWTEPNLISKLRSWLPW